MGGVTGLQAHKSRAQRGREKIPSSRGEDAASVHLTAWELTHFKQCSGKVITKSYHQPVLALHTCTDDQIIMLEKSDGSKVMTEMRS